jgi:hypothetical protein
MEPRILNGQAFGAWLDQQDLGWFTSVDIEALCQDQGIYYDIGHFYDWIHRQRALGLEERPSERHRIRYSYPSDSGAMMTVDKPHLEYRRPQKKPQS